MRIQLKILGTLGILLMMESCEKDININYHDSDPMYVVEASISNQGTKVRISRTQAMDNNSGDSDIDNATVVISSGNQLHETIPFSQNGFYISRLTGTPGNRYQLDIDLNGHHFSSTSIMQQTPQMTQFRLVWKEMLSQRYLFGDVRIQDIANEDNWYFIHLYRNDIGYRWAVIRDDRNPNKELQQLLGLFQEGSSDSDVLQEGDRLRLVIRAIDQRAYDYLYSMETMDNTGTNPIANFTGGCLGYFSAYGEITYNYVFHISDIVEEDE